MIDSLLDKISLVVLVITFCFTCIFYIRYWSLMAKQNLDKMYDLGYKHGLEKRILQECKENVCRDIKNGIQQYLKERVTENAEYLEILENDFPVENHQN